MRIVAYNILDGGAPRGPLILAALQRLNPDVLCLIEADDVALVRSIAGELKMNFVQGQGEKHSVAILSKFPIASSINHSGLYGKPRNMLEANIVAPTPRRGWRPPARSAFRRRGVGATELPIVAVHLKGGAFLSDEAYRLDEIDLLLKLLEPYRKNNIPHILAGDFNSNSPIQRIDPDLCTPRTKLAFEENGRMIPREVMTKLFEAGYRDSLAEALGEQIAGNTGSFTSEFPGQRLDYILTWNLETHLAQVDAAAGAASDHFPVDAEITSRSSLLNRPGSPPRVF